jgi:hypothetical protein
LRDEEEEVANVRGNVEQRADDLGPMMMGTLELRFATPTKDDNEEEHAALMTSAPLREEEGRQRERWRAAINMLME